jgi:hypothetical protein
MSDEFDDLLGPAPVDFTEEEYQKAVQVVRSNRRAATSFVQRKLGIGYNRAHQMIERMEAEGVVGKPDNRGKREILGDDGEPPAASFAKPGKPSHGTDAAVVQALLRPVSISFLADVLMKDRKSVTKRLANLTPMGYHRGNIPLYDFRQAMGYLVTPKMDAAEAIRKMGADDLPIGLQKDVWDARLKQQKWMEQAGELWRTEAVLEVLGEAFQRLKTTTQLWIDQLSESHALPADVRKDLTAMVDGLQQDLHATLVEMPKERATTNQLAEIEGTDLDV